MTNQTHTSPGQDFSKSSFYETALLIDTIAPAEYRHLPKMQSGAELVLDALSVHRNELLTDLQKFAEKIANGDPLTLEEAKAFIGDELVRDLAAIQMLSTHIDVLASHLAADLREVGNAIVKREGKTVNSNFH